MLDNTVAGGIQAGDDPFDSMVRECYEEAGFQESLVRGAMKVCSNIGRGKRAIDCHLLNPTKPPLPFKANWCHFLLLPYEIGLVSA